MFIVHHNYITYSNLYYYYKWALACQSGGFSLPPSLAFIKASFLSNSTIQYGSVPNDKFPIFTAPTTRTKRVPFKWPFSPSLFELLSAAGGFGFGTLSFLFQIKNNNNNMIRYKKV